MPSTLELRVTVLDTWDEAVLHVPPDTLVSEVKRAALEHAKVRHSPADYEIKYQGALLDENGRSLADARIPSNGALIVLPRRRRPVR